MDSGGEFFLLALFGIFFATIGLGLYIYCAYRLGQHFGRWVPLTWNRVRGVVVVAAVCAPFSLWSFLTDWNAFMKVGIGMAFYLLNAFPLSVGYVAAIDVRKENALRRFRKNVDDWLGEWECEPAPHLLDEDDGDSR